MIRECQREIREALTQRKIIRWQDVERLLESLSQKCGNSPIAKIEPKKLGSNKVVCIEKTCDKSLSPVWQYLIHTLQKNFDVGKLTLGKTFSGYVIALNGKGISTKPTATKEVFKRILK